MKFEIDKKTGSIIAGAAVIAFLLGTGLNHNREDGWGFGMMGMHNSSNSGFSANDIMFAQMMIPHHQQAVEMSDLALATSTNLKILALAKQIRDAQAPEISQMKKWLTSAGTSLMGAHGMTMDGMLTDSEIATLIASKGNEFDRLFLSGMIGHHEGALTMVSMIVNSDNAEARTLAKNIKVSQSAEIAMMKEYLATLTK